MAHAQKLGGNPRWDKCTSPHPTISHAACASDVHLTIPNLQRYSTKVDLYLNSITIVRAMMIWFTVTFLNLSHNHIREVELDAFSRIGIFQGESQLEHLNLSINKLTQLNYRVFEKTPHLRILDLSRNKLTTLPATIFVNQPRLEVLIVTQNSLSSLPDGVFTNQLFLTFLDLSHNQLSSLPAKMLVNSIILQDIRLNRNRLTSLPEGLFSTSRELKNVDLEYNSIQQFPVSPFPYSGKQAQFNTPVTVKLRHNPIRTGVSLCTLPRNVKTNLQVLDKGRVGFPCIRPVSVTQISQCVVLNGIVQHVCFCKGNQSIPNQCQGNPCPAGWTPLPKGADINCVKYTPSQDDSYGATTACKTDGGKLARFEHANQNDFHYLQSIVLSGPIRFALIGYNFSRSEWFIGDTHRELVPARTVKGYHCAAINPDFTVYTWYCYAATSYFCQRDLQNQCDSSPCQHGGTCIDDVNSFTCKCPQPFVGTTCNITNTCLTSWTPVADGDHVKCLKYTRGQFNLKEASSACRKDGGMLARLARENKDDLNYLRSVLGTKPARIGVFVTNWYKSKWRISALDDVRSKRVPQLPTFIPGFAVIDSNGWMESWRPDAKTDYICQKDVQCPYGYTGPLCNTKILRTCNGRVHLGFPDGWSWQRSTNSAGEAAHQCYNNGGTAIDHNTAECALQLARANPEYTTATPSGIFVTLASKPRVLFHDGNTKSIEAYGKNPPKIRVLCVWKSAPPLVTDGCSKYPCQNGGACTPQSGQNYTCKCTFGFTGPNCDVALNRECARSPCPNGGTCIDQVNSFVCKCTRSYVGPSCNISHTCPASWTPLADGDHVKCVKYEREAKYTFEEAYLACARDGGKLARYDETNENDRNYLQSILKPTESTTIGFRLGSKTWIIGYTYKEPIVNISSSKHECAVIDGLGVIRSSSCFGKTGYICQKDGWCANGHTGPLCNIKILRACNDRVHLGVPTDEVWKDSYVISAALAANRCTNNGGTVIDHNTLACAAKVAYIYPQYTTPTTSGFLVNMTSRPQGDRLRVLFHDGNTKSIQSYGNNPPEIRALCVWKSAPNPVTDGCSSNPCHNGATCAPQSGQKYICTCAQGFSGPNCDVFSPCSLKPQCFQGSTCINQGNSYICKCTSRHVGSRCKSWVLATCKNGMKLGFPWPATLGTAHRDNGRWQHSLCRGQGGRVPDDYTLGCVAEYLSTLPSEFYKPPSSGVLVNLQSRTPDSEKLRLVYRDGNTLSISRYLSVYGQFPYLYVICVWKS